MSSGFYLMHRGWMDDPTFKDEPFTEREAFMWMIENAVWEPEGRKKRVSNSSKLILIPRGSLCFSKRFMAKKWGWTLGKVQRYTRKLQTDTLIDAAVDTGETIVSIRNYEKYQKQTKRSDTPIDTASDTLTISKPIQRIRKKEIKELKEGSGTRFALQDPPSGWIEFCSLQRPELDPGKTFDSFRDYWMGVPGQRGRKLDWFATWRNWVRSQKTEAKHGNNGQKSSLQRAVEATERARAAREQREQSQTG